MKNLVQSFDKSDTLNWTNAGSAVAAGDAVLVSAAVAAIAAVDIANGASGTVVTRGRFTIPKATGGGTGFPQGTPVTIAAGMGALALAGEDVHGYATEAAADGDATFEIELAATGPNLVPAPLLVSAAYASGTGILTLTFDQDLATPDNAPSSSALIVHTAAEDVIDWIIGSPTGPTITLLNNGTDTPTPTQDTLDWVSEPGVFKNSAGQDLASVSGFAVTVT